MRSRSVVSGRGVWEEAPVGTLRGRVGGKDLERMAFC